MDRRKTVSSETTKLVITLAPPDFPFPFEAIGPYLVAVITETCALFRHSLQALQKFGKFILKRGILFCKPFELSIKRRYGKNTITHPAALLQGAPSVYLA